MSVITKYYGSILTGHRLCEILWIKVCAGKAVGITNGTELRQIKIL